MGLHFSLLFSTRFSLVFLHFLYSFVLFLNGIPWLLFPYRFSLHSSRLHSNVDPLQISFDRKRFRCSSVVIEIRVPEEGMDQSIVRAIYRIPWVQFQSGDGGVELHSVQCSLSVHPVPNQRWTSEWPKGKVKREERWLSIGKHSHSAPFSLPRSVT